MKSFDGFVTIFNEIWIFILPIIRFRFCRANSWRYILLVFSRRCILLAFVFSTLKRSFYLVNCCSIANILVLSLLLYKVFRRVSSNEILPEFLKAGWFFIIFFRFHIFFQIDNIVYIPIRLGYFFLVKQCRFH